MRIGAVRHAFLLDSPGPYGKLSHVGRGEAGKDGGETVARYTQPNHLSAASLSGVVPRTRSACHWT